VFSSRRPTSFAHSTVQHSCQHVDSPCQLSYADICMHLTAPVSTRANMNQPAGNPLLPVAQRVASQLVWLACRRLAPTQRGCTAHATTRSSTTSGQVISSLFGFCRWSELVSTLQDLSSPQGSDVLDRLGRGGEGFTMGKMSEAVRMPESDLLNPHVDSLIITELANRWIG
ncbi:unnamed protein product, partial [Protopolystoma xenopodis]